MNLKELNQVINLISDCDNYLMGKQHSRNLADIAEAAAHRAVLERRDNLLDRLRDAGLNLVETDA